MNTFFKILLYTTRIVFIAIRYICKYMSNLIKKYIIQVYKYIIHTFKYSIDDQFLEF